MAGSVNKVVLVGRVGQDPEVRNLNNGGKVVNLSVATSERWKDKNSNENKERTEWHRVVIWNERAANFAEQYLKKGALVYIEGALETRKYTDNNGVEKYTTEVVLRQFRGELISLELPAMGSRAAMVVSAARRSAAAQCWRRTSCRWWWAGAFPPNDDLNDEIPF